MSDDSYQPMNNPPAAVKVAVRSGVDNTADSPHMNAPHGGVPDDEFRRDLSHGGNNDRIISGGNDDGAGKYNTRSSRRGGGSSGSIWRVSNAACAMWTLLSIGAAAVIIYLALKVSSLQSQLDDARRPPHTTPIWTPPTLTSDGVYAAARADLVNRNFGVSMARGQVLNDAEAQADATLATVRSSWLNSTGWFPTSQYFFNVKPVLERSPLFPVFQRMPKGGVLHVHTGSLGDMRYIVSNLTYRPNCYVCLNVVNPKTDALYATDYFDTPAAVPSAGWVNITVARAQNPNLDNLLFDALTMSSADSPCNLTTNSPFPGFDKIFGRVSVIKHVQPFRDYYMDGFEKLIANGVQYVDVRAGIGGLKAANGTRLPGSYMVQVFQDMRTELQQKYASIGFDFHLILSYNRGQDVPTVESYLREAFALKQQFPDIIVGFDLVSYEDAGHTTAYFEEAWILHQTLQQQMNVQLPYYFHAGESDEPNDTNIFDALVAGTKRIGHGFDLFRFGYLEQVCTANGVAIEVCPLSNQILDYVSDVRIHPAAGYLARNVPVVLSSDDPGIFGYVGMGYDFLVAYVAWGLDLRMVKQLLQNSLTYAAFASEPARDAALTVLNARWNDWIASINAAPPVFTPTH